MIKDHPFVNKPEKVKSSISNFPICAIVLSTLFDEGARISRAVLWAGHHRRQDFALAFCGKAAEHAVASVCLVF